MQKKNEEIGLKILLDSLENLEFELDSEKMLELSHFLKKHRLKIPFYYDDMGNQICIHCLIQEESDEEFEARKRQQESKAFKALKTKAEKMGYKLVENKFEE